MHGSLAQFGIEDICRQICVSAQVLPANTQIPTHRNLTGPIMTAPPPLPSPSSILPPPSFHWIFLLASKNSARFSKKCYLNLFTFVKLLNWEVRHWHYLLTGNASDCRVTLSTSKLHFPKQLSPTSLLMLQSPALAGPNLDPDRVHPDLSSSCFFLLTSDNAGTVSWLFNDLSLLNPFQFNIQTLIQIQV